MNAAGSAVEFDTRALELTYQEVLAEPQRFRRLVEEWGVVVIRGVFEDDERVALQREFDACYRPVSDRRQLDSNPVIIQRSQSRDFFSQFSGSDKLVRMSRMVYGDDIALYFHRLLVKDKHYRGSAWAHNDFPYYSGFDQKLAFFLAITENNVDNGSLWFAPRTHRFGYLGAKSLNKQLALEQFHGFCPDVRPGDVVATSFYIWHWSEECRNDRMRAFLQVVHQPSNDGSGWGVLLSGQWQTDVLERNFDNLLAPETDMPTPVERAPEQPERVLADVPLDQIRALNGGVLVLDSGALQCTTGARQWAYAAHVAVPVSPPNTGLKLRIHAVIETGTLGFGWLSADKQRWLARRGMEPTSEEKAFDLPLPDQCPEGMLVFDNWTSGEAGARALIRRISLVGPDTP